MQLSILKIRHMVVLSHHGYKFKEFLLEDEDEGKYKFYHIPTGKKIIISQNFTDFEKGITTKLVLNQGKA